MIDYIPEKGSTTSGTAGSVQRVVRRKHLRRDGVSFRTQDDRMKRLRHQLEEAHGSLVIARTESLLLQEPCSDELSDAIDCVESAIEQTLPPNRGAKRPAQPT